MNKEFVFIPKGSYGDVFNLIKIVKPTGYKFFLHNGIIFFLNDNCTYADTGIRADDLY